MELLGKIKRMHVRDKISERAIAKRTDLSRNTVHKWLQTPEEVKAPGYVRAKRFGKLAGFAQEVELALKADASRNKQDRRSGKALFVQIKDSGYAGSYCRVTDFIRAWRINAGKDIKAYVPLKFDLGEAFQFDWSEEGLVVGGIYRRMQVSHMKLCASRAFWLVACPSQGHEMLFDAHTRSFAALGGVARRGIYDNMKTAVDKVKKGKSRSVNARFAVIYAHYLFDADFCNVAAVGRKVSLRRTCKIAGGASGSMHRPANGSALKRSTLGWASGVGLCGKRFAIPSTNSSASWTCCSKSAWR